jgi:hypothetical protein
MLIDMIIDEGDGIYILNLKMKISVKENNVEHLFHDFLVIKENSAKETAVRLFSAIKEANSRGMTLRDINKINIKNVDMATKLEALDLLKKENKILLIRINPSGRGRPREAYVSSAYRYKE